MNLHRKPVLSRIESFALYLAGSDQFMAHADLAFVESNVGTARAVHREAPPLKSTVSLLSSGAEAVLHEHETAWLHDAQHLANDLLRVMTTIDPITGKNQVERIGVKSSQEFLRVPLRAAGRRLGRTLGPEAPVSTGQRVKADQVHRVAQIGKVGTGPRSGPEIEDRRGPYALGQNLGDSLAR